MNTDKQLTVKVMSFSYRKGMYTIREDMTNTNL